MPAEPKSREEAATFARGGAVDLLRRCGRWLWDAVELSPEAMLYADPIYMSPAFSLLALEAEAQMRAAAPDNDAGESRDTWPRKR